MFMCVKYTSDSLSKHSITTNTTVFPVYFYWFLWSSVQSFALRGMVVVFCPPVNIVSRVKRSNLLSSVRLKYYTMYLQK